MNFLSFNSRALRALAVAGSVVFIAGCATTPVFRNGQVLLPVLVASDAAPEERAAAEELGSVLEKMSGLAWPVRPPAHLGEHGFHVGRSNATMRPEPPLKLADDLVAPNAGEIGPDGFRIWSRDGSVVIEGATPEATGFAVAWLLQREGGVRWYVPGATGEIVPRRAKWSLPKLRVVREPAYVSREITGLQTPDELAWARHNGLRGRLEFSHALDRVFPSTALGQPNLALPEVAEHAAQAAAKEFASDPPRPSFSLGINDNLRFDEGAATRQLIEPLHYFRGKPDYSPLVFTFMNRAAESLAQTNPDRYLGCLAYFWCENSPSFPVNVHVLPFVTTDRTQYYDRKYRAEDLALMSRWGASGVRAFGLWEYAYGQNFLVPREPLAALAESVREGWRRGARGYFAEVGPQWGFDAFKVWMLAQLLWEPNRSPEQLAEDFYRGYFGAAATPMRRFFERCEEQWMAQPGPAYWLKFYQQEDQALLFPAETCREMRTLLAEAAHASARDRIVAARVERTSRAFAVTEAFVELDEIRRKLGATESEEEIPGMIRKLLQADARVREQFNAAIEGEIPAMSPMALANFVHNDPVPRLLWLAGQRDALAPARVLEAAGADALEREPWRVLADLLASGKLAAAPNLATNGSFAESAEDRQEPRFLFPLFGARPAHWELRAMPTENGKVALIEAGTVGSRGRVLRIEGAWDTQLYQWHPVEAGSRYVATARVRGKSSLGNDAALFLTFVTADGKAAGNYLMQSLPKGLTRESRTLALADRAPVGAAWVGVGIGVSRQVAGDWIEVDTVKLRGVTGSATP